MANYAISPDKKAAALAALAVGAQTDAEIAASVGVAPRTLQNWRAQAERDPNLAHLARQTLARLMPKYAQLAEGITDRLLEQVDQASYENKASTVLGILTDKLMAAAGMAGQVIEHRHTLDLSAEAHAALRLYLDEGFTLGEARKLLAEDDPELARHLPVIEGELVEDDPAGNTSPETPAEDTGPASPIEQPAEDAAQDTPADAPQSPPDESAPLAPAAAQGAQDGAQAPPRRTG